MRQRYQPEKANFGGNDMELLKKKKLFLLDMDGTIYLGDTLFDGTLDFLEYVKKSAEDIFL